VRRISEQHPLDAVSRDDLVVRRERRRGPATERSAVRVTSTCRAAL